MISLRETVNLRTNNGIGEKYELAMSTHREQILFQRKKIREK